MSSLFGKRILRGAILFILAVCCLFTAVQINSTEVEAQAKSDSAEITNVPFSLSLNGNNAALSVAHNNSLSMTGAMTLESWVKPFDTNGSQMIIDRMTQNLVSGSGGYQLRIDNGVAAFMICSDNLRIRCVTTYGANKIQANRWQHIAAVFENGGIRIYFNGQIDGQRFKTTRAAGFAVGEMTIGANHRGRNQFRGLLDEIRICNTAIYNGGFSLAAQLTANQSTVGLWRFDNGSVNDWSTYNHQTTIVGMATFSPDVPSVGGSGFILTDTPNVGESNVLNDVKTISATEVWAVGTTATCGPFMGCSSFDAIIRYDGTNWTVAPVEQFPANQVILSGISASGSNDVWVVGLADSKTLVLHYENGVFRRVQSENAPPSPNDFNQLFSVSALNPNEVWTVGSAVGIFNPQNGEIGGNLALRKSSGF